LEVALVGNTEPEHYQNLPLSTADKFKPFSKYPYIVRDVSIWLPEGEFRDKASTIIKENAGDLLMGEPRLVDSYGPNKDGKISNLWRLIFQSFEKTLTEVEANERMEMVSAALKAKGFEIR